MTTPEPRASQHPERRHSERRHPEARQPEARHPGRRRPPEQPPEPPLLTLHAAVVLVAAVLVGFTAGGLSHLGGVPAALAVLAGLGAAGGAVPVLRGLIR
ncbi:hypothetical protein [Streptomyces sp. NBC_00096]|uniref:hypothetical protein n=1 Tax=Streptomyces sp. NBC_00096 TaxID=2975650 RepID=UPI00325550BF